MFCRYLPILSLILSAQMSWANVELPRVFGDHMVLQREARVPVWGWGAPGEEVTVELAGQRMTAITDDTGHWRVDLAAMPASGPFVMTVKGLNTITFEDVMIGEVWICSGQSNMEWKLGSVHDPDAYRRATNALIRQLYVPRQPAREPQDDIKGVGSNTNWTPADGQQTASFTAVGYTFAERLNAELGCAVGIINTSWGGTSIRPWISEASVQSISDDHPVRAQYLRMTDAYQANLLNLIDPLSDWIALARTAADAGKPLPSPPILPAHPVWDEGNNPNSGLFNLYNGMIAPLVPYAVRGAIWYQGESDAAVRLDYLPMMETLVDGWREAWGQKDFSFYYVQLASFQAPQSTPAGGNNWAFLREAQRLALASIPDSGMAVTIDIGEANDIHPRNKLDVGNRLAQWALHQTYGRTDIPRSGPLFRAAHSEANAIRIEFDDVHGGLVTGHMASPGVFEATPTVPVGGFAVRGNDGVWQWAEAVIEGDSILVKSDLVAQPVAVRYAFDTNPDRANLYNGAGLPASPFEAELNE